MFDFERYLLYNPDRMRTLTFLIFLYPLYSQDKTTIPLTEQQREQIKEGNTQNSNNQNSNNVWRRFSEQNENNNPEDNTPCWKKEDPGDPTFCLSELEAYKNTEQGKKQKGIFKPKEKWLRKLEKVYQARVDKEIKKYNKDKRREEKIRKDEEKQRKEEAQAHYDANIHGCPNDNVEVSPLTRISRILRFTQMVGIITIINISGKYIDIIGTGQGVLVKNLCPNGSLDLTMVQQAIDSDQTTYLLIAKGMNPDGTSLGTETFRMSLYRQNATFTRVEKQVWKVQIR